MPRIQAQTVPHGRRPVPVLLAALLLATTGCWRSGVVQQRVTMRVERWGNTVDTFVEGEQRRPQQLARSVNMVRGAAVRDIGASRAGVDRFERYWRRDWERLTERTPRYKQQARGLLGGKPEHIGRNAIILFFEPPPRAERHQAEPAQT